MYAPLPPMNPEVARLRRQSAQRKYLKGLRYVRALWAMAAVLLFTLLIEVMLALCFSPRFWIYRVVVHGNETIADNEVLSLLRLPAHSNYYRTSLHELAQRVQREPRVWQVTVRRQSVGVLGVELLERTAACRLGDTLPLTYLDADGYLYTRPIPPQAPVPVVEGVTAPANAKPGHPLHDSTLAGVLACLTALREKSPDDPDLLVHRVAVTREGKLILVLQQGTRVYLGDAEDLTRKLWVVRQTVLEAQKQGYPLDNVQYIDAKVIERLAGATDTTDPTQPASLGAVFKPRVEHGREEPTL